MKKFLALLLTALMVLAMFTACAKTATPSQEETTAPTETCLLYTSDAADEL